MTSTDPQAVLATMSPTMIRSLHAVHDGHTHEVDGQQISALKHRGLISLDVTHMVAITPLGYQIIDHLGEQA